MSNDTKVLNLIDEDFKVVDGYNEYVGKVDLSVTFEGSIEIAAGHALIQERAGLRATPATGGHS